MSIKVMTRVWELSRHKGSELLLMLALADWANDDGVCWPSIPTLARKVRMSERQVQRMVRDLVASHELYADTKKGRGHTTRYIVLVGLAQEEIDRILQTWLKKKGDKMTPFQKDDKMTPFAKGDKMTPFQKDDKMTPFAIQKDDPAVSPIRSAKGDISDQKGDTAMSPDPLKIRSVKEGGKDQLRTHGLTEPVESHGQSGSAQGQASVTHSNAVMVDGATAANRGATHYVDPETRLIPVPPLHQPPLPSHPFGLWEAARPNARPMEFKHLEALAVEHDQSTGDHGLYWVGRAILAATISRDVESVGVIKTILERLRDEESYGSDAPVRQQRRRKERTDEQGGQPARVVNGRDRYEPATPRSTFTYIGGRPADGNK